METIKLWARNGDAVRQALELGELVYLDTASEELTDAFLEGVSELLIYYSLTDKPTVCLGVTSAVVYTYGCGDGRIAPTRCALIDGVLGDRYSQYWVCSIS